jgi:hypothetical protein
MLSSLVDLYRSLPRINPRPAVEPLSRGSGGALGIPPSIKRSRLLPSTAWRSSLYQAFLPPPFLRPALLPLSSVPAFSLRPPPDSSSFPSATGSLLHAPLLSPARSAIDAWTPTSFALAPFPRRSVEAPCTGHSALSFSVWSNDSSVGIVAWAPE